MGDRWWIGRVVRPGRRDRPEVGRLQTPVCLAEVEDERAAPARPATVGIVGTTIELSMLRARGWPRDRAETLRMLSLLSYHPVGVRRSRTADLPINENRNTPARSRCDRINRERREKADFPRPHGWRDERRPRRRTGRVVSPETSDPQATRTESNR